MIVMNESAKLEECDTNFENHRKGFITESNINYKKHNKVIITLRDVDTKNQRSTSQIVINISSDTQYGINRRNVP